ncbi:protein Dia2p [[Candida] anglica]
MASTSNKYQEIIDSKIQQAIELFKNKKYENALQIYTALIRNIQKLSTEEVITIRKNAGLSSKPVVGSVVHPKLGSILDQRAATYERLSDNKRALRDSENLIKLEPIGCKGYLRASKIMILTGQEVEAYKVLQRGVYTIDSAIKKHNIVVPQKLFDNLKLEYRLLNDKLKRQQHQQNQQQKEISRSDSTKRTLQQSIDEMLPLKKSKQGDISSLKHNPRAASPSLSYSSRDPFQILPLELIELVFQHLPFKTVLKSHLVCKTWYKFLTSLPSLYKSILFKYKVDKSEFLRGMTLMKRIYSNSSTKIVERLKLSTTLREEQFLEALKYLAFKADLKYKKMEVINPKFNIGDILLSFLFPKNNILEERDESGLTAFNRLEALRLGVSASTTHIPHILGLSNHLESLELIHMSPESTPRFEISNYKYINFLKDKCPESFPTLSKLAMIGHPQREDGGKTHLLKYISEGRFPNLQSLTIVSQDLRSCDSTLVKNLPYLKELYLENNTGYDLNTLLGNFIVEEDVISSTTFAKLEKLVFREKDYLEDVTLEEWPSTLFPGLATIKYLDLNSTSLTRDGLYKLLSICNVGNQLSFLNIGAARKISFPIDNLNSRINNMTTPPRNIVSIAKVLQIVPTLTHLYLNELEFDNYSAKMFYRELKENIGWENVHLKVLDLSFARIDGIGLMDLFYVSTRQGVTFTLDELILNGIEINQQTIQILMNKGYVGKVINDFRKTRWREYGINSLIQE